MHTSINVTLIGEAIAAASNIWAVTNSCHFIKIPSSKIYIKNINVSFNFIPFNCSVPNGAGVNVSGLVTGSACNIYDINPTGFDEGINTLVSTGQVSSVFVQPSVGTLAGAYDTNHSWGYNYSAGVFSNGPRIINNSLAAFYVPLPVIYSFNMPTGAPSVGAAVTPAGIQQPPTSFQSHRIDTDFVCNSGFICIDLSIGGMCKDSNGVSAGSTSAIQLNISYDFI